jgi:hypothetical protein
MTYSDRLKRWVVVRLSSDWQHTEIARFYRFSDADNCARILQQREPQATIKVIFDAER